jgi:orotate phosphoribosyltransferase
MKPGSGKKTKAVSFATAVGRALRRAARTARKTAKAHGTPIYIWKDGKVVAEKP